MLLNKERNKEPFVGKLRIFTSNREGSIQDFLTQITVIFLLIENDKKYQAKSLCFGIYLQRTVKTKPKRNTG